MKEYSLLRKINESQWSNDSGSKPGSFYAGEEFTPTTPLRYRRPMPPRTPSLRSVAPPNSRAEKEADELASRYSNRSSETKRDTGKISDISPVTGNTTTIQASGSEGGFALNQAQESHVNSALQSEGSALSEKDRTSLEEHTGKDLSDVRIHTGDAAERAATSINAKAFTVGKDIVFAKDQYRPGTKDGDHLLAHEVAHTVQGGNTQTISRAPITEEKPDTDFLPRPLPEKVGTLDYYRARHNDFVRRYGDTLTPPDYYLSYGDKYARKFTLMTRLLMSDKGKKWIDKTFRILQQKIEDQLKDSREKFDSMEKDGDALRDFAFQTHPKAYVEGGLATLDYKDLKAIYWTIDSKDMWTLETFEQAIKTVALATPGFAERIADEMERDVSNTKYEIMRWLDWKTIYNTVTTP